MEKCPACNAKLAGKAACPRCKANLGHLLYISQQAEEHRQMAAYAFMAGDARLMLFHAQRAVSLRQTPEHAGLLFCAAVMAGRFETALGVWAGGRLEDCEQEHD